MVAKSMDRESTNDNYTKIALTELRLWLTPQEVPLERIEKAQSALYGINDEEVCFLCAHVIVFGLRAHSKRNKQEEHQSAEEYYALLKENVGRLVGINVLKVANAEVRWWHAHDKVSERIFMQPNRKNDVAFFEDMRDSSEGISLFTSLCDYYGKLLQQSPENDTVLHLARTKTRALIFYSKLRYFQNDPLYTQQLRQKDENVILDALEENFQLLQKILRTAEN